MVNGEVSIFISVINGDGSIFSAKAERFEEKWR